MDRIRVDLNGPPQTMLATLYAKALDADALIPNSATSAACGSVRPAYAG